jgi:hypothetical protein
MPVLEVGRVGDQSAQAQDGPYGVSHAIVSDEPGNRGCRRDRLPGRAQKRRYQQNNTEVSDRRRAKGGTCGTSIATASGRARGNERQYDELQPDQRTRGRADDQLEGVPFGEFGRCYLPEETRREKERVGTIRRFARGPRTRSAARHPGPGFSACCRCGLS